MLILYALIMVLPRYYYSLKDTISLKGVVEEVVVDSVENSKTKHVALRMTLLDSRGEKVIVLGPPWFFEELPKVGDTCEVMGSVFRSERLEIIVARSIYNFRLKKGVAIRSQNGFPLWTKQEGMMYRERMREKGEWRRGKSIR
ncbi:MAG: hypothetical protein ACPLN0_00080 [Candidatus Hydrothermia bacterium]